MLNALTCDLKLPLAGSVLGENVHATVVRHSDYLDCLLLTGATKAATVFYDNFEDGSATDGLPVAWLESEMFSGTFDASSGNYFLAPSERAVVPLHPGSMCPMCP